MPVLIPLWFYEFGAMMYLIIAIIGVMMSYFSFKLYSYTWKRQHALLHYGFLLITVGFLVLTISNLYTVSKLLDCQPDCEALDQNTVRQWMVPGIYGYYGASLFGYVLLAMSYMKTTRNKSVVAMLPAIAGFILPDYNIPIFFPFESSFFELFHIMSIAVLSYIVVKTLVNYRKTGENVSLFVSIGFSLMLVYHALMFSIPFSPLLFAVAHVSLTLGFASLLLVLVKVNLLGRAKV